MAMPPSTLETEAPSQSTFEQVARHRGEMLLVATRVLRERAAAEDVVQDVLLDLWLRPESFDPSRGSLRSYVLMLTRSRALDRWRSGAARAAAVKRASDEAFARPSYVPSAADVVVRRDGARQLTSVLAELPDEQRDALLLAYGRGLSAREVASAVGVPLGTAKSRLRLGLGRARVALAPAD
jgi:RNA polymerase sigma-70 factor (ECF subfamily)